MTLETDLTNPLTAEIREIPAGEIQSGFLNILNAGFNLSGDQKFFDDFPLWSESSKYVFRRGVFLKGELISCASLKMSTVVLKRNLKVSVGIIGAVATKKGFEGQGFASAAVEDLIQVARNQGAALLVLWGSERFFYSRLGFELTGVQVRIPISRLVPVNSDDSVQFGWNPALLNLMKQREMGVLRTEEDLKWLTKQKNVVWAWTGPSLEPKAFLAFGRGIDLPNIVHEWGGSPDHLKILLTSFSRRFPKAEMIGSPELMTRYGFGFDLNDCEFLCMAKVLNPKALGVESENASDLFGIQSEKRLPLWFWGLDSA